MDVATRAAEVQNRIADAAIRAGRKPDDITLIAVSKTYGVDAIQAAYEAGLRHFGENRVEEAEPKIAEARSMLPEATWHMIGHIQSRKTSDVAAVFDWVHSVERFKIARRLSEADKRIHVLLEVNLSGEASKDGYALAGWPDNQSAFQPFCDEVMAINGLGGIHLQGLMTMAPYADDPEEARPIFRRLRQLRDALCERLPDLSLPQLSMGMSGDFDVAVEEGATMVRVGTAIFGAREV